MRPLLMILLAGSLALYGEFRQNTVDPGQGGPDMGTVDVPDGRNTRHNFEESDVSSERDAYGKCLQSQRSV